MLAVRENRYIVLAKDFEKAYKTVIKKDEQEHEFYNRTQPNRDLTEPKRPEPDPKPPEPFRKEPNPSRTGPAMLPGGLSLLLGLLMGE
ncbi:hypothetical protein AV530_019914 [Patagioenas fasciata monilis]|uniref:Uncharacterized protein n=1 Tax=Patagioenas fasciata monilis TaxID=372326 RepID=A0A1V4L1M9_PATFA|nr:hypothetical protein AV530_019914 [Patagioenas fasciata monilis]